MRRRLEGQGGEDGAQTLEFAMMLPAVALVVVLVIHAALLGVDLVAVHGIAREAARVAAVDDDSAVDDAVWGAIGEREVQVDIDRPVASGDSDDPVGQVTANVRLRSRAFTTFGADLWLPAQATMRVEQP